MCTFIAFTIKSKIKMGGLVSNHLCYPAQRSEQQPLSETTRGVVKAPSVEAPPSEEDFPVFKATCWRPRGGAQADSLGSAQLPGAAALALSQGLSCCRNTTRDCNRSRSQHPDTPPPLQPRFQSEPHLLRISTGAPTACECTTALCSALSIYCFNSIFILRSFV